MSPKTSTHSDLPPIAFGLASVILAAIALLMFFLPVLSLPISGAALVVGAAGAWAAMRGGRSRLRLSVAGVLLAICAQGIVWSIAMAPSGYFAPRSVFPNWRPIPAGPYVPPPAPSRGGLLPLTGAPPSE